MSKTAKVWTKQHENILHDLNENGRYIVKEEYIKKKMEEHADLYLGVYSWYTKKAEKIVTKPLDVKYPIWVSLSEESKIENSNGNVLLEIDIDENKLITIDLDKWGYVVNYMYIPKDEEDKLKHENILKSYNVDDTKAYMSPFYPHIKNKIIKSWDRLFDDNIKLSPVKVGTIWEIKKEWIAKTIM